MLSQYKTLLRQGEDLYEVISQRAMSSYMKNDQFLPDKVEEHKKAYNAEHVVHTPDHFIYLKRIEELTEVEYITNKTTEDDNSNSSNNLINTEPNNSGNSSEPSTEIHRNQEEPENATRD